MYRCISGFEIVSDDRRTCLDDGQWSGAEPICQRKQSGAEHICKVSGLGQSLLAGVSGLG